MVTQVLRDEKAILREQRNILRELLRPAKLAIPTAVLAVVCPLVVLSTLFVLAAGIGKDIWYTYPVLFLLNLGASYLSFTPMHDAVHGAVSKNKFWNHTFGRMAGWCLFAPYNMFRWCHLTHHSFTNIENKDPDHYSGIGPKWQLPLRWASQDIYYYVFTAKACLQILKKETKSADDIAFLKRMAWSTGLDILNIAIIVAFALHFQIFLIGLLVWILPVRISIFLLSFGFDFLPHIPHNVAVNQDRYRTTSVWDSFAMSLPLCNQNYHAMHHLYPAAPFYKYHKLYFALQKEVKEKGTPIFEGLSRQKIS